MRNFIKLVEKAAETGTKIDGSAFLYLSPKPPKDDFAQCKTCVLFKPESRRCGIFGPDDEVAAEASCGFYLHGEPNEAQECQSIVTQKEAGYVQGSVRCENCSWFDGQCGLYRLLMQKMPDVFDLDPDVDKKACCNAFTKVTP